MTHILVVNPNTSAVTTRNIDRAVQTLAQPGERFQTVPAAFGPELIITPEDSAKASKGVIAAVEAYGADVDGIIVASFGDTALGDVRAACPGVPVIGIATASLAVARAMGGMFSVVSFTEVMRPSIAAKIREQGMDGKLKDIVLPTSQPDADPERVQEDMSQLLGELCRTAAEEDITCIVLAGGPLAGLAWTPNFTCPVPIIDGPTAAISMMRATLNAKRLASA